MRIVALCMASLLCLVAAANGPSNPAQWTLARQQPRMRALTAAIAARRRPSLRPSLEQSMESRIRDPKPSIAVHNNGTHLLLKLAKGDQEHCAALVARPSAPDNEQDDDATEITLHLNQVSAVGLDPSAFLSDVDPKFYGVFGVLSTSSGHYLGLISKVEQVLPEIFPDMLEIKEVKLLAIPGEGVSVDREGPDAASVFRAMNSAFQQHSFCFSTSDFDPTRTLQWNAQQRAWRTEEPAWKLSNRQFFWNQRLLKPMMDAELHEFITPVANMVIHSMVLPLAGRTEYKRGKAHGAQLVLVSRRSCNNQGQRYIKRGIDPEGNVANFVETEQIFRYDNHTFSFTQIRGSIPLFWRQLDKYKLHPKIRVESDPTDHLPALHKHIQELQQVYLDLNHSGDARITFVNLIDKVGDQGRLGAEFRKALAALQGRGGSDDLSVPDISAEKGSGSKKRSSWRAALTRDDLPEQHLTHLWFDFHHNCKGRHLRSLRRLHPAIFANNTVGYFGPVEDQQAGRMLTREQADVVRTNCIDCLDRTNVVQSVIGRWALQSQMRDLGLLPADKPSNDSLALPNKDIERAFRTLWGKNGDSVSLLYAGSPALKRDITILGRRTRKGMLEDGFNSLLRYYINNFRDESRQRAVDLLLGLDDTAAVVPATLLRQAALAIQANLRTVLAIGLAYLVAQLMYRPGNNRTAGR